MRIKKLQQNIKNFFLTNSFLRKIKNILNNFIKPILLRSFLVSIGVIFILLIDQGLALTLLLLLNKNKNIK